MQKIRLDPADELFSQAIRIRDGRCLRCGSPVIFNDAEIPVSHQASHYFGRSRENTRFDLENVDTLCGACHRIWGSDDRESYREFKLKQLGPDKYQALVIRAALTGKKDRKMQRIRCKIILKFFIDKRKKAWQKGYDSYNFIIKENPDVDLRKRM